MSARDELDSLALQADLLGGAPAPGDAPGAPGGAPGADAPPLESPNLGVIVLALTALREASVMLLRVESPRATLGDAEIRSCADVLAPVADKYGMNVSMQFGPELAAAFVAGPILWNAYSQLSHELNARRAKPVNGQEVPAGSPASSDQAAPAGGE